MMSVQFPGGYAEQVVAPAHATHLLPDGVTAEMAAAGQVVFTTAWHMIVTRGRLRPGETVVVQAAGAASATRPIQVAALNGARVIATAGADHKLARAPRAGGGRDDQLQRGVDRRARPRDDRRRGRGRLHRARRRRPVHGQPARAAQGRRGSSPAAATPGETPELDLIELFRNEWQVIGSRIGTPAEMQLTMRLMGEGRLAPDVHAAIPLAEAAEAHRIIEGRKQTGKVVLVP